MNNKESFLEISPSKTTPRFCGIINVTPDSFSDGGKYIDSEIAISKIHEFKQHNFEFVDIGADSTRPGSKCVGSDVEIKRIKDIAPKVSSIIDWSIDTHNLKTAEYALSIGARIINDITGGSPEMFSLAAKNSAKIICMFSAFNNDPHMEKSAKKIEINRLLDEINIFWNLKKQIAKQEGLDSKNMILDPGMGAFLGQNSNLSLKAVNMLVELTNISELFVGISRKGFLKVFGAESIKERDYLSAAIVNFISNRSQISSKIIWRVHEYFLHNLIAKSVY